MTDQPATFNGLTLDELLVARKLLQQAKLTGTLSVQYPDGTRVQYRTMAEMDIAMRDVNAGVGALQGSSVLDPYSQPVRMFRMRPSNGYR